MSDVSPLALPFRAYARWASENSPVTTQMERTLRMMLYFSLDPTDLLHMESGYTFVSALSLLHREVQDRAAEGVDFHSKRTLCTDMVMPHGSDARVTLAFEFIREVQSLLELAARRVVSHGAGWQVVVLVQVLKVMFSVFLRRHSYAPFFKALATTVKHQLRHLDLVAGAKRLFSSSSATTTTTTTTDAQQQQSPSSRASLSGGRRSPIVIPRVSLQRGHREGAPADMLTWRDIAIALLDVFYTLRPIALAVACALATRSHWGKHATRHVQSVSAAASRPAGQLLSTWRVWRVFTALEVCGALVSYPLLRHAVPTVTQGDASADAGGRRAGTVPHATDGGEQEQEQRSDDTGGPAGPAGLHAHHIGGGSLAGAVTTQQMKAVLDERTKLALGALLREPFFSSVLRDAIVRHFVNGWFNRYIPLFGPLLANAMEYLLAMHRASALYSAGF